MTKKTRNTLKGYFETGKKPTEGQYANLIDSHTLLSGENTGSLNLKGDIVLNGEITTSGNISSSGTITANQFVGDGKLITGITSSLITQTLITASVATGSLILSGTLYHPSASSDILVGLKTTGSVIPGGDGLFDLGSPTHYFKDIFVSKSHANVVTTTNLTATEGIFTNITASGNISASGTIIGLSGSFTHLSSSGIITAASYVGLPSGILSSSAQLPSGILSSSAQLPSGILSSSAQIASDISGSWQGQNFVSASQTFLSTGQRSGDSAITGALEVTTNITSSHLHLTNATNPSITLQDSTHPETFKITQANQMATIDISGGNAGIVNNFTLATDYKSNYLQVDSTTGTTTIRGHLNMVQGGSTSNSPAHITASGNISASGDIIGDGLNINGHTNFNDGNISNVGGISLDSIFSDAGGDNIIQLNIADIDNRIDDTSVLKLSATSADFFNEGIGHITASGNISASGTIIGSKYELHQISAETGSGVGFTIENVGTGDSVVQFLNLNNRWSVGIDNDDADKFKIGGGAGTNSDLHNNPHLTVMIDGKVGIGTTTPTEKLTITGNVSASGNIISPETGSFGYVTSSVIDASQTVIGDIGSFTSLTSFQTTNITASGGISASGTIHAYTLETDTFASTNITASGNISASGILYGGGAYIKGNTTASGNISSSGTIIANNFTGIFNGVLSSSAQIAANISGALSPTAIAALGEGIFSGSAATISGSLSSTAIAALGAGIFSGSAATISGSLSSTAIASLGAGIFSGSAATISGSLSSTAIASLGAGIFSGSAATISGSLSSTAIAALGANIYSSSLQTLGNVTSSGTIIANNFTGIFNGALSSSAQIAANISGALSSTAIASLGGYIISSSAQGHITSSGNISSSGNITANNFTGIFNGALSSSAQIAANISGALSPTAIAAVGGYIISSSAQGHITASGNISSSGTITANNYVGLPVGLFSGSAATISGSLSPTAIASLGVGIFSGSAQLPTGIISSSAQLPTGTISSSAQLLLLASETISGSLSSTAIASLGAGIFSGSAATISGSLSPTAIASLGAGIFSGSAATISGSLSPTAIASLGAGIFSGSAQLPSGTYSSSLQTLGNVTSSGTIIANNFTGIFNGALSSSAQIAANISGALSPTAIAAVGGGYYSSSLQTLGNITSSGHISSSGNIITTGNLSSIHGTVFTSKIHASSHITASGNISSSGTITATSFTGSLLGNVKGTAIGLAGTPDINVGQLAVDTITTSNDTTIIEVEEAGINLTGQLTSSGNISSSGTIIGNSIVGTLGTAAQTNITSVGTLGSLTVTGNITANGNIIGDDGTHITNIDSIGLDTLVADADSTTAIVMNVNSIDFKVQDEDLLDIKESGLNMVGHITASGNISSSGTIKALTLEGRSNVSTANNTSAVNITMTEAVYPGGSIIGLDMDTNTNDIQYTLPALTAGLRYTFLVNTDAGTGVTLKLTSPSSGDLVGVAICDDGNEDIVGTTLTIDAASAFKGTKLEVVSDGNVWNTTAFCLCNVDKIASA